MAQVRGGSSKGGRSAAKVARMAARNSATRVHRAQLITESLVDKPCKVHNGRSYVLVRPTREMVRCHLKFGEFAKTRTYRLPVKKTDKKGGKGKK